MAVTVGLIAEVNVAAAVAAVVFTGVLVGVGTTVVGAAAAAAAVEAVLGRCAPAEAAAVTGAVTVTAAADGNSFDSNTRRPKSSLTGIDLGSSLDSEAASAAAVRLEFGCVLFTFPDGVEDAAMTGVVGLGFDDSTMPLVSVFGAADAGAAEAGGGDKAMAEGADDWRADAGLDAVLTGANEDEAVVSAAAEATA